MVVPGGAGDVSGEVVELGLADRLELREAWRVSPVERPVGRLAGHRGKCVLGQNTLTEDGSERHGETLLGKLGLHSEEESPEDLMVPLDHLGVLSWGLRLQLNEDPVEELRHLLRYKTPLAVRDQDLHSAEVANPT